MIAVLNSMPMKHSLQPIFMIICHLDQMVFLVLEHRSVLIGPYLLHHYYLSFREEHQLYCADVVSELKRYTLLTILPQIQRQQSMLLHNRDQNDVLAESEERLLSVVYVVGAEDFCW
jgi:hypothetical protein